MFKPHNLIKSLITWFVLSLVLVLNIFIFKSLISGLIFGTIYLLYFGYLLGQVILPSEQKCWQILFGLLFFISLISIIGAIIYYFFNLSNTVISLILTILPLIIIFLPKKNIASESKHEEVKLSFTSLLLVTCYLLLVYSAFKILIASQTIEAIRSPWWIVPKDFFIIYFLATFTLLTTLFYNKKIWLSLALTSIYSFLTLSVALIVYKLGYGFDPFLHQATEKVIATLGQITPKPLYYLGQYSLVVILSKIFQISVVLIDKLLLIALTSIYLPATIYFAFTKIFNREERNLVFIAPLVFLVPFSSFIVTTPQGLANLFTILTIFFGLILILRQEKNWLIPTILLALTTLLIHPLSGIPIVIFVILTLILSLIGKPRTSTLKTKAFEKNNSPIKNGINAKGLDPEVRGKNKGWGNFLEKSVLIEIVVLTSIALPLIFVLFSVQGGSLSTSINTELIANPKLILSHLGFSSLYLKNHFNLIFDLVYYYGNNIYWVIFIISLLGVITLLMKRQKKTFLTFPLTFLIVLINFWILKNFISFPSLIEYERINYPQRLLEISFYFLLPFLLYSFYLLISNARLGPKTLKLSLFLFLALFLTSSMYLTYPRDDDYHLDRGYNLTQADIDAARYINQDGQDSDYIVLANQMTSAAAIKEFGFKKYFPAKDGSGKEYFYYPVPTGDPLYQYYLDMVYDRPKKETAIAAMDLVGVKKAYFVINKYWWKFDLIVEQAKEEAERWVNIDDGRIYIFEYEKED